MMPDARKSIVLRLVVSLRLSLPVLAALQGGSAVAQTTSATQETNNTTRPVKIVLEDFGINQSKNGLASFGDFSQLDHGAIRGAPPAAQITVLLPSGPPETRNWDDFQVQLYQGIKPIVQ